MESSPFAPLDSNAKGVQPAAISQARLSAREHAVAARIGQGASIKVVASDLSITEAAAGTYLARAKRKALAVTRMDLQKLVAGAPDLVAVRALLARSLTAAEIEVAEALLAGQRNAAIAQCRQTSVRTVENQIATVFRKLRVNSRYELLTKVQALNQNHL